MSTEIDWYEAKHMVDEEERERRRADEELRELVELRYREALEEIRDLREQVAASLVSGGTLG